MIAAVFHGRGKMEVAELDRPDIGPDESLVRVGANTLCGTDVRALNGENWLIRKRPTPSIRNTASSRMLLWRATFGEG